MDRTKYTLQESISVSDARWQYHVSDLPKPEKCRQAGLIKSIELACSPSLQGIFLRFTCVSLNRATRDQRLEDLVQVSVSGFRPVPNSDSASVPTNHKQAVEYIARFLSSGVVINGQLYSFYGHSNSQLKSRSCYLLAGSKEEVRGKVDALGDFAKIKSVAKKAKRIGLLFSTADIVQEVPISRCRDIDDIERDGFIFTDGCGLISKDFARSLASKKPIVFRDRRYHPSVLQIRYLGYKGVVSVDPKLEKGFWLKLRKSMKKFTGTNDMSFAVVEHSKPYTYGYLNDEIVLLLHSLGITTTTFTKKQAEYFDFLEQSRTDPRCAFRLLSSIEMTGEAEKLLIEGFEKVTKTVRKAITQEYGKMVNKRNEQKTRILIPKSRLLFGICDHYDVLKFDECFLRVTLDEFGHPTVLKGVNVLVSRNPCLHPGDVRKLKAVDRSELHHLTDCVVFSTRGKRPTADLMSGGDLDGDTFFVCWDSDLIPQTISQPAEYPGVKEATRFSPITTDDLISYFAGYNNMSLGRVKKLYLGWARASGPQCTECQELNRLFSQCVDGNRIKIPERLLDPPAPPTDAQPFVLDALHDLAVAHCRAMGTDVTPDDIPDRETLEHVLNNPIPFSDFELAKLTLSWCRIHRVPFEDFWAFFDPSQLTSDEQGWIISELPPIAKYASYFKNGLLLSNILSEQDLHSFKLDYQALHWKCVFDSKSDSLRNLMTLVSQTFHQFSKKLLVLSMGERLSVAIYFPRPIEKEEEVLVDGSVRLFAFPHTHKDRAGHRRVVPTEKNYRFYYDESVMQLYNNHRHDTFIFFTRSAGDESRFQDARGKSNPARGRQKMIDDGILCDWRMSIALNKFSSELATHIGRTNREPVTDAELYVISNKDVRALRALDLWLESIDTLEVLPNFPDEKSEYSLPTLKDIGWDQHRPLIRQIIRDKHFDRMTDATGVEIAELLRFCWKYDLGDIISQVYARLLGLADEISEPTCSPGIIKDLIDFLYFTPTMVVHFARLCPWASLPIQLATVFQQRVLDMLRALLLSANKMGELVVKHLCAILQEDTTLTLAAVKELLECASLAVKSPELLLTIFMECRDSLTHVIPDHDPHIAAYFLQNIFGIMLDHCDEVSGSGEAKQGTWKLKAVTGTADKVAVVTSRRRIDAPKLAGLAVGDHVRFVARKEPLNSTASEATSFEALVEAASDNEVRFRTFAQPPIFTEEISWIMKRCGPFVTCQTMAEALVELLVQRENCCGVYHSLMGPKEGCTPISARVSVLSGETDCTIEGLNDSQRRAVTESISGRLTCLWGPPGTGKTSTIIALLRKLLKYDTKERVLVSAPTHNAVDNVLRQYTQKALTSDSTLPQPLRVSTELSKVADDLKSYTCDAMFGKDLNQFPAAKRKAIQRVSESRLVFTTCVGAALGLLRKQTFDTAIIDEASQQTEPASLVPLVKGCRRAVLVGDHVQLRATVGQYASALDFDVSLMERLWTGAEHGENTVGRVMLDTQYRMHPDICNFPSNEFYERRLLTADICSDIPIPVSNFPWPRDLSSTKNVPQQNSRSVFIECSGPEDYGRKSKVNQAQAQLCKEVLKLLMTAPADQSKNDRTPNTPNVSLPSIAILTPYSRQADLLRQLCGRIVVSSIDGFQGQEADIVIYVTVRCNLHGEIGFLKDMRRLNVALTRAKAGLIIIGNQSTLTWNKDKEEASCRVWDRLIKTCAKVRLSSSGKN
ncbi:uncharacterized protein Z518_03678 [Rhinocladiella mackenziei CBS 650.93]|uniref:AAA+ ATPase domain-containing protein n=1 Tax=Rhinocladiella mackenziei CBS 650.93 TaxID=1442369 RepID=A0A0D2IRB9_9EURO|nr:uncharacterized protein Z518_03678 [Rhinocladiella mackenziei CBS 650.93]KIX05706.1 hypothetical protein Z518_03678 [Rhinocladiella mackenziei CBS 650.93]